MMNHIMTPGPSRINYQTRSLKVAVWQLNVIIFFSGAAGNKTEIRESECWP